MEIESMLVRYFTSAEALAEAKRTGESVTEYEDLWSHVEMLALPNGCRVQSGGNSGDGFCFEHQSFDCKA